MKRLLLITFLTFIVAASNAQVDEFKQKYDGFKRHAEEAYNTFRDKANRQYAEFMKQVWLQYKTLPAIPKPKDEDIPPAVMPEEDREKPIENKPVPIKDIITPPAPQPQPLPVEPIKEQPQPVEEHVTFRFFGTDCKVRFNNKDKFKLAGCGFNVLADTWERMSGLEYNNLIRDCLELRTRLRLCDWAYLNMLNAMAEACMGKTNEATMLMAFVYCQSGYKMRLGISGNKLYMLYASEHDIYEQRFFNIDGEKFYPFNCDEERMSICNAAFPKEQALSLMITQTQALAQNKAQARKLQAKRYPEMCAEVSVNKNLIDFYYTYPTSEIGNDFMTRWAMYANTPMDKETKDKLYPALTEKIKGMSKKEAAERLLNLVQTAFVYEYDDNVWGYDRAFFAEETLYYPYCDCEDRSILFSRLVRDLLGLDVILIYYPGHLATAVCFTEYVNGDYITLNGRRFVVCDPTYIGAPVGHTMPDMNNKTANVIVLKR